MLCAVCGPEDQAISIDSVVLLVEADLKDYLVLEEHEDAVVFGDDFEGFQALVDYDSCQADVWLYSAADHSHLCSMVIRA